MSLTALPSVIQRYTFYEDLFACRRYRYMDHLMLHQHTIFKLYTTHPDKIALLAHGYEYLSMKCMNSFSSKSSIFAIIIHKPIKGLAQVQPDIESIGIIKGLEMTHDNLETAAIYILHHQGISQIWSTSCSRNGDFPQGHLWSNAMSRWLDFASTATFWSLQNKVWKEGRSIDNRVKIALYLQARNPKFHIAHITAKLFQSQFSKDS